MTAAARALSLPPELACSWPMIEARERFGLGFLHDEGEAGGPFVAAEGTYGLWECDLATDALQWSPLVYDLFGLPRDVPPVRSQCVRQYVEGSRVIMERLRAHAIRHCRGFTLDAEIRPLTDGGTRWMRLVAAPVCVGPRAVRLHGIKSDVTHLYR